MAANIREEDWLGQSTYKTHGRQEIKSHAEEVGDLCKL